MYTIMIHHYIKYLLSGLVYTVCVTFCDSPVRGYYVVKLPKLCIYVILPFVCQVCLHFVECNNYPFLYVLTNR